MGVLRLIMRLLAFFSVCLLLLPPTILVNLFRINRLKWKLITLYYKCACFSWGIRVRLEGEFSPERPLLVVSNHCSYADIPVLGSKAPVQFTPKAEIADWPIIGSLCRLADCVFINRNPRKTAENMAALTKVQNEGGLISLFPEGTTNNGITLLPFRSSYFSLAEQGLPVQPVTLRYHQHNGQPLSAEAMRKISWIGDDEFAPHLLELLKQPSVSATIQCHKVIHTEGKNRKMIAQICEQQISEFLS